MVNEPVIIALDIGDDVYIIVHHAVKVTGDLFVQVMAEDQLASGVVHPGTIGGDHESINI